MFISPKKHILSNTILIAALIRVAEFLISGILRTIRRQSLLMNKPDGPSGLVSYIASESEYSKIQTALSLLTVILTAVTFIYALKKTGAGYAFLYNLTHGFKYQGMLIALLLGIVVTAIFLSDRSLKLIAYTIGLAAFAIYMRGRNKGV